MEVNDKSCINCKYDYKNFNEEPCIDCYGFTRWEQDEEMQIKEEKRPELLPKPYPIYERPDSEIPERVRISFANGTSALYELHVDQPAPVIMENIKIIRRMKQGYTNQPVRRRRRKYETAGT